MKPPVPLAITSIHYANLARISRALELSDKRAREAAIAKVRPAGKGRFWRFLRNAFTHNTK